MKKHYLLSLLQAACFILISFFSQSCGGLGDFSIEEAQIAFLQTDTQQTISQPAILPLTSQTAQGEHDATFYQQVDGTEDTIRETEDLIKYNKLRASLKDMIGDSGHKGRTNIANQMGISSSTLTNFVNGRTKRSPTVVAGCMKSMQALYQSIWKPQDEEITYDSANSRKHIPESVIENKKTETIEQEEKQEINPFDIFPPEIWQEVFSYLDFEGVLSARAVNRDWSELITGPRQAGVVGAENKPQHIIDTRGWTRKKEIDFTSNKLAGLTPKTIPSFAFCHLMGHVRNLPQSFWPYLQGTQVHTVNLTCNDIDAQGAVGFAKHLQGTRVRTVDLSGNGIGDQGAVGFAKHLQGTRVRTVDLSENGVGSQGAVGFAKHLQGTRVHTVDLGGNYIGAQGAEGFAKHLQGTRVHTVDLSRNKIRVQGAEGFAKHLQGTRVHTVDLSGNKIGDQGAVGFAKHLQGTRVHTVDLNESQIGDQGAVALAQHLHGTQVHTLNLRTNGIGDAGARELAKALPETQVHTLSLSMNGIRDAGAIELAKALPGTQVHTLDLSYNQIRAEGARELAKALPATRIHTLDLGGNQIEAAGALELAKALPGTQVHTLYLYRNQIGDAGARELTKALPEAQVHTLSLENNQIGKATQQLLKEQYSHIKWWF
jgi:Ran GTPase-activating protein (RanGAP) involved in mRNA processing and transport